MGGQRRNGYACGNLVLRLQCVQFGFAIPCCMAAGYGHTTGSGTGDWHVQRDYVLVCTFLCGLRIGQMKAALRSVHLPRVFVDALVVAFRVLPTVGTEAVAIREAMEMRGVDLGIRGVLRHPLVIAERFLVPLLSSIARVADDLAASSVIRGLGGPTRPTSLTQLRVTSWDLLALACVAGVIAIEICAYLGVLP